MKHPRLYNRDVRLVVLGLFAGLLACSPAVAADVHPIPAQAANAVGGAPVVGGAAGGGTAVHLAEVGQGVKFTGLPAASKLAVHYGSVSVGTISVLVNDKPAVKLNLHSS